MNIKVSKEITADDPESHTIFYGRAKISYLNELRVDQFSALLREQTHNAPVGRIKTRCKIKLEKYLRPPELTDWPPIPIHIRKSMVELCLEVFAQNIRPTLIVVVEGKQFHCHNVLLRALSAFVRSLKYSQVLHLPSPMVTAQAFITVYRWVVEPCHLLSYSSVMDLNRFAHFLDCENLILQCFKIMDKERDMFPEKMLSFYQSARNKSFYPEASIYERMGPVFLPFAASSDFLQMGMGAISRLLHTTTIAVNTEMEVLLAGVRWLSYRWPEREAYIGNVLDGVRFDLMPFVSLLSVPNRYDGPPALRHVFRSKLVRDRIQEAAHNLYRLPGRFQGYYSHDARLWIYDPACPYHHTSDCMSIRFLPYRSFARYLKKLHNMATTHWRRVKRSGTDKIICCPQISNRRYFRSQ